MDVKLPEGLEAFLAAAGWGDAVIEPLAGVTPSPELAQELMAFCAQHLAHMKCPKSIDFTDKLPRLPTGKLYKRVLRDAYWAGHKTRIV